MIVSAAGGHYKNYRELADGEFSAGRMTAEQRDQFIGGCDQLLAAVEAFDWTGVFSILSSLAPLLGMFVPQLAWITALLPVIQQIIQTINGGGSAQNLVDQIKQFLQQLFNQLPKPFPLPGPIPGPTPVPTPTA